MALQKSECMKQLNDEFCNKSVNEMSLREKVLYYKRQLQIIKIDLTQYYIKNYADGYGIKATSNLKTEFPDHYFK